MNENQMQWAKARDQLAAALADAGYPSELAEIMAKQLRSPKAIDRMTAYVRHGYARNMEMLADEMLAISADAEAWREKKENQEAQAKYNAYLYHRRLNSEDKPDDM
ncbi:MAG: hypothetical protein Q4G00_03880 [Clostridia bacterium]|nr:hypothetical protein [Clostridia bacterium]